MITKNAKQTIAFAKKFAKTLKGGNVILLEGDLGSGKTTFTKGLAQAFGIKENIKSPTFVLIHEHPVKKSNIKTFVHIDAYRTKNYNDLIGIGLMDLINKDSIVIIEWGEKVLPALKKINPIRVGFKYGKGKNERILTI